MVAFEIYKSILESLAKSEIRAFQFEILGKHMEPVQPLQEVQREWFTLEPMVLSKTPAEQSLPRTKDT